MSNTVRWQETKKWHDAVLGNTETLLRWINRLTKIKESCSHLYQHSTSSAVLLVQSEKPAHLLQKPKSGQTVKPCLLHFETSEQMAHLKATMKKTNMLMQNTSDPSASVGTCWWGVQFAGAVYISYTLTKGSFSSCMTSVLRLGMSKVLLCQQNGRISLYK